MSATITHSFIVSVLESYAMVDKQARLLSRILPDNWELILVDDGSDPPIPTPVEVPGNFTLIRTGEIRQDGEWTQHLAINRAVAVAQGEYIVKNDIDHVFTPGAIEAVNEFTGDMLLFHREAGRLNDDLTVTPLPDHHVYSLVDDIYTVRKSIYTGLGGYGPSREYGSGGKFLWEYSQSGAVRHPPKKAVVYVVPDTEETYHNLVRKRVE